MVIGEQTTDRFVEAFAADEVLIGRVLIAGRAEQRCRVVFVASDAVVVSTEAIGRPGQDAICYLEAIGAIQGRIGKADATGFTLHLIGNEVRSSRVTARVMWQAERQRQSIEQRTDPRIVPHHRTVAIRLPDCSVVQGQIENLSKSGALIGFVSQVPLEIGSSVTVGKRYATVVRFEAGMIAVRFRLPYCDATFNPSVVL